MTASDAERVEELLAARALGCIDPDDANELERILEQRPELSRELAELESTASMLSFALPASKPDPAVRQRVLSICGCQVEAWWSRLASLRWFPAMATTSAVTASVLISVFVTSSMFNSEIDSLETQVDHAQSSWELLEQECRNLVADASSGMILEGQGTAAGVRGCLLRSADPRQAMLVVSGIKGVGGHGDSYAVWMKGRGLSEHSYSGSCAASRSGRAVVSLRTKEPIEHYDDLVVTVEPAGQVSDVPSDQHVLWADLKG